jgi:adenylate cyclase
MLNQYFAGFDEAIERSGLEKLKTIGDAYMAVTGVLSRKTHTIDACLAAFKMLAVVDRLRIERQKLRLPHFEVRIGIHSGPMIAGIVGAYRFTYDVWGDTVNVAALMEANGEVGAIHVSERVFHSVAPYFSFVDRRQVGVKHGQSLRM